MTVLVDDRPSAPAPVPPAPRDRSAIPAWRLAVRLARRETRRRPGRTVLASLLIAIPVIAMTLGSVAVRSEHQSGTWAAQFDRQWPGADVVVNGGNDGRGVAPGPSVDDSVVLPEGARRIEYIVTWTAVTPPDTSPRDVPYAMWTDIPLADPMIAGGSVDLLRGRLPRDGEVLLAPDLARVLRVDVGDTLTLERPAGSWTVAGVGRFRDNYDNSIIVVPGFDRDRIATDWRSTVVAYDLPDSVGRAQTLQLAGRVGGFTRYENPFPDDATSTLAWGWVGGVLALVAVGIIVAAAFATSARRQLVAVGQLASNGATPGVIRRTLVLQGTWTAAVGAAGGLVIALAALPFLRGTMQDRILRHDLAGLRVAPFDLAAIAVTALVAGTIAAAVPARSLAKVPVMAALSGRRPLGQPPRWLVPTGVALTLGGLGLLAVAGVGARNASLAENSTDLFALVVILGAVAVVFGMICATPLVIERAGRLARRLPLSPRIALRGMARSRTRSAAVVAAIAVAVGGSIAAGMVADDALIDSYAGEPGFVPDDALVLQRTDDIMVTDDPEAAYDAPAPVPYELSDDEVAEIETTLPGASRESLLVAVFDPPPFTGIDVQTGATQVWANGNALLVATDPLLDVMGVAASDRDLLDEEGALLLADPVFLDGSEQGYVPSSFVYPIDGVDTTIEATMSAQVPTYGFGRSTIILTEAHARELGFDVVPRGVIVRNGAPITQQQQATLGFAFGVYSTVDAFVEPGDAPRGSALVSEMMSWSVAMDGFASGTDQGDLWLARAIIAGAALVLVALVVAIGLSLAAAEGREERDALTIVGATPATMRRQTAVRAVTMALTGIVLGIPTGFLPAWVLWTTTQDDAPSFPWAVTGLLVVAVPVVVGGVVWLATAVIQRVRPVTISRRD